MNGADDFLDSHTQLQLVLRFNDALNAHDVQAMLDCLSDDTVFENTYPPPDGARYEGKQAVQGFWQDFFRDDKDQKISIKDIFACDGRCVMRWTYHWNDAGIPGYITGIDLYTFNQGGISGKYSYVKG